MTTNGAGDFTALRDRISLGMSQAVYRYAGGQALLEKELSNR